MATKIHFTQTTLKDLPLPEKGYTTYHDDESPHLQLRVRQSGVKTFYYVRKHKGRPLYKKLGPFSELTVFNARKKATEYDGEFAKGNNPIEKTDNISKFKTFSDIFNCYRDEHGEAYTKSIKEDQRIFGKYLQKIHNRQLQNIDRQVISRIHRDIKDNNGPYMANRAIEVIKKSYNYCIDRYELEVHNPASKITKFKEHQRERYLNANELRNLFEAMETEVDRKMADFFSMLLLTGQRRSNVQSMRWKDIQWDNKTWTIPAAEFKTNKQHTVTLPEPAMDILERRYKDADSDCPYVFPSGRKTAKKGHITEPKSSWHKVRKKAGLDDVRLHDLRRTLASWMAADGASLQIIGKSLGQNSQEATRIYSRLDLTPIRASVNSATDAMIKATKSDENTEDGQ